MGLPRSRWKIRSDGSSDEWDLYRSGEARLSGHEPGDLLAKSVSAEAQEITGESQSRFLDFFSVTRLSGESPATGSRFIGSAIIPIYKVIRCSKINKAKTSLKHEEIKLLEYQTRSLTPKKSNQVNISQPAAKKRALGAAMGLHGRASLYTVVHCPSGLPRLWYTVFCTLFDSRGVCTPVQSNARC
ncbi:hypothetical protein L1987_02154 [Smallanthus sonchifolius]|uniref:Uncharacterized protein n=1 Tax=Smallanthus sonchifolius TaxID=185202 RepID=A0ACB9K715_9ASTR|nr:hypothetical protein L1987_02154 [Smallanthus sonchifolius]